QQQNASRLELLGSQIPTLLSEHKTDATKAEYKANDSFVLSTPAKNTPLNRIESPILLASKTTSLNKMLPQFLISTPSKKVVDANQNNKIKMNDIKKPKSTDSKLQQTKKNSHTKDAQIGEHIIKAREKDIKKM
ncbi:MAG: hypothetical protein PSV35_08625, partial [bacterium]|nr:hypothetical protein [bacterium]